MARFGVSFPRSQKLDIKEDVIDAVAACIDLPRKLDQPNPRLKAKGKPLIKFGLALHTGPVVAGVVGGHRPVNYFVIGDTGNRASRLESAIEEQTADSADRMLLGSETFAYGSDRYLDQQVWAIQLRGQTKNIVHFTILTFKNQDIKANVTKY